MKTEILDNYIEVTTEAVNFVTQWVYNPTSLTLKYYGINKGEDIGRRVSVLKPEAIRTEIFNSSSPTDLRDCASLFANRLSEEGSIELWRKEDDLLFNYENEYYANIKQMEDKGLISAGEAKGLRDRLNDIVMYVYQNSEELIEIFKVLRLKETCEDSKSCDEALKEHPTSSHKKTKDEIRISKFSDIIQSNGKKTLLKRLHSLIDVSNKGVDIAAIISKATLDKYLIRLPNKEEVCSEFKLPCTWEAVRKNLIDSEKVKSDKRYIAAQGIVISE